MPSLNHEEKYYLNVGSAQDLPKTNERSVFRAFEILPGVLAWGTILGMVLASWQIPVTTSFFIIAFDLYWLLKALFFSIHIRASYRLMRENLKVDWMKRLKQLPVANYQLSISSWEDIHHLVILPFFREPYEVLRDSVEAIKNSSWPKNRLIVALAVEERGGEEDLKTAERIRNECGQDFFKFLVTIHPVRSSRATVPWTRALGAGATSNGIHPANLEGEIPGKGSNETWAAKEAKKLIDGLNIPYENIIVSSLDADTQIYPDYLTAVTYKYLTETDPLHTSYQPIPIYHNNVWDAPAFSRVVATSDTFWQMVQQSRPERLTTFSSHSMPFKSLVEMGFWQTNVVSEDSRIFWKALLFYDGNWRVSPLCYPVSMDVNIGSNFRGTLFNVYRQHRRWGWGVENVPYILFGFWKNQRMPFRKKLFYGFNQLEGFWSLSTNPLLIFVLGWLPPIIGGAQFSTTVLAYNLPKITRVLMTLAMIGIATSSIIALELLPTRPAGKPKRWKLWLALEWLLVPITGTLFVTLPGLEAQTRLMLGKYLGFWKTPKSRKIEIETGP